MGKIGNHHKAGGEGLGGKVERFVSRGQSQRLGGERDLHSSESVAKLTEVHHFDRDRR